MSNVSFDAQSLDRNARRRRLRKTLLIWVAGPVLLLLVVGMYMIGPSLLGNAGADRYKEGEFKTAGGFYGAASLFNLIEPYKAYYNQGTALIQADEYDKAIAALDTAYAYTKDGAQACQVLTNLTLAYEARGDNFIKEKKLQLAIDDYIKGLSYVRSDPDCFKDSLIGPRLAAKLDKIRSALSGEDDVESEETTESEEPSDAQKEQLKKQQNAAHKQRMETLQRDGRESVTPDLSGEENKPW